MRHNSQLGDLPGPLSRERELGKKILNPGTAFVTDYINRNTLNLFPFVIGTTSRRILPGNPLRTYLAVQNKSGGIIHVNFGSNATPVNSFDIPPGGNLILEGGVTGFSPGDDIYLLGSLANLNGVVGEGLYTPETRTIRGA